MVQYAGMVKYAQANTEAKKELARIMSFVDCQHFLISALPGPQELMESWLRAEIM